VNYTGKEGFNPSDDGVIIAQSYRLIHGEIPHKDFVSIRPVGSGLIHCFHFFSPGSLMQSMRFFVVLQYFLIALLISLVIKNLYQNDFSREIHWLQFSTLFLFGFIVSILDYNLFPWTTIDAICCSLLAFTILLFNSNKKVLLQVIALMFVSLAVLTRQSFALLAIGMFAWVFVSNLRRNKAIKAFAIILVGGLPLVLYFLFLLAHHAVFDFVAQMTGRTELVETGVLQYGKYFFHSWSLPLHVIIWGLFGLRIFIRNPQSKLQLWLNSKAYILSSIILVYMLGLLFYHFLDYQQDIYRLPFELFWLLIDVSLLAWISVKLSQRSFYSALFVLLLAWTSSISLGDNSPVFAAGIIASMVIYMSLCILKIKFDGTKFTKASRVVGLVAVIALFVSAYFAQENWNYRDLPSKQLHFPLSQVDDDFGNTLTNNITGAYYAELKNIYTHLPNALNHTVVLPNNAMFYPMFQTRNPMPIDWMQPAEYVGQERRVFQSLSELCHSHGYYFIIDKIDSKQMAFKHEPLDYKNYPYMDTIFTYCKLVPIQSDYFMVYQSE
jgi:hypothetical protein